MKTSSGVYGKYSDVAGTRVRRVFDSRGVILGTITKTDDGQYRVFRITDGKIRVKKYLDEAFKTIKRRN
jgi:hypothetical protein